FADLAIGEPGATINKAAGAGDVIVLYGSSGGLTTTGRALFFEGRDNVPGIPEAGDNFGSALASGDFNADGYSDLAIGIPNKNMTTVGPFGIQTVHKGAGAVVVIYGSGGGLGSSTLLPESIDLLDMNNIALSCGSYGLDGAHFGQSLAWG